MEVESSRREVESSCAEVERAKNEVEGVIKRLKEVWRMSCDQLISHEEGLAAKDAAIAELNRKLLTALGTLPGADHPECVSDEGHDHSRAHHALVVSGIVPQALTREKLHLLSPVMMGPFSLRTGYHPWKGLYHGIHGQVRRRCCSSQATSVAGPSRSGT